MVTILQDRAREVRNQMRGGEGDTLFMHSFNPLPAGCRVCATLELPAGASIGYHVHEKETEIYLFMQGHGQVQDNSDEWIDVYAGDCMQTPSGTGHAVRNVGEEPFQFVAVIIQDQ